MKSFQTYSPRKAFHVGDIKVTPFFVSHSAADSYMLLIECDGKRVLHTGDLREHGYLGKGLEKTLMSYISKVDVLITEGTMLSRDDEHTLTENEIQTQMSRLMAKYGNVFVICSSTNFDRLAGLHKANAQFRGRPFVCDVYQNNQFKTLARFSGKHSDLYLIDDAIEMSLKKVNLHKRMVERGFTMVVRDNPTFRKWISSLMPLLNPEQTVLVYSQYKGYLKEQPRLQEFVKLFGENMVYVHTSGHATRKTLAKICNILNPTTAIIPIHKDAGSDFLSLDISDELKQKVVSESLQRDEINIEIL
jgi:ribonuclease J